ncbi:hypothetical protein HPO96_06480 [Kribbella sandramycini]|uniref:Secreted protein n=1 Tax=Kribbella sandramycini TaxID=60450 RepID=A0A7Y4KW98_9ACTN|nr:hypothetical protein [Kribbella sandramycini]MBB6567510.1 hypothetical protein [Kribbella sandramycini]NOL39884.1 hypothetical protein [Kribbella sandramycini]
MKFRQAITAVTTLAATVGLGALAALPAEAAPRWSRVDWGMGGASCHYMGHVWTTERGADAYRCDQVADGTHELWVLVDR